MKLHLNLSLRRALLAAMAAVATFAPSATAGLVDARYDLQYYLDFGYNMGLFRPGATNITVPFKDGTSVSNATIPLMPNLDSYALRASQPWTGEVGGGAGLVAPQYVISATHCKEGPVYFVTESGEYDYKYTSTGYVSQPKPGVNDWSIQRLDKIVTEVAYTPYASDDFMRNSMKLNETWLYRTGQGDPKDTNGGIATGRTPLGGLCNLSSISQNPSGTWVFRVYNREFDTPTDTRPPLEISMTSGDSGSPIYAWDDANNQFVQVGFCSAGNSFSGYTGDIYICYNPTGYDNFIDSCEVKASNFSGKETILWGAQDATTGKGFLTQGDERVEYTGAGSANTTREHLGLTFSTADSVNTQTIELQGSVNMGAGAMTFDEGSWKLTETNGASTFNSAGFIVNGGADLTLELTASANEEWRKVGEGIMTIAGSGNNEAVLRIGGGNTVYHVTRDEEGNITGCTLGNLGETRLDRDGGYAASSIRLEGGVASIVLMRDGQIKSNSVAGDSFTFGNAGGLLNLNGHDLTWGVINQDGSGKGARIGNMTTQDGATPGKASTFIYTGTGTFAGCFMDEGSDSSAKLALVYNNTDKDASWTLTGNHDIAGGYTVKAGTLVLQGTPTPHSLRKVSDDWDFASMQGSDVTVESGAAFQLSHHARLVGNVTVENGGKFIINQVVNADSEAISGDVKENMAGKAITSMTGNVVLKASGFSIGQMVADVSSSAITTLNGDINIEDPAGDAYNSITLTKTGNGILSVTGKVNVYGAHIEEGGLVVGDASIPATDNWYQWTIGEKGFLAAVGIDDVQYYLQRGVITDTSNGVLALTADQAVQLTGKVFENGLYIGAWGDVSYGTADASLTAYNKEWHLGGGTGTLTVNFKLVGDNDLIIGNEWSSGTVHLTNENNMIGGEIIIKGTGNMLTYESVAALGGARVNLSYGNAIALHQQRDMALLNDGAQGVVAVVGSFDLDTTGYDVAIGAAGDVTFTGALTVGDTYRFGGSGNLTLDTELDGSKTMKIDGMGTTGSSVTFAREDAYTGSITAGGGLELAEANSRGSIGIHVAHGEALASVAAMELQKGATLYMDGQSMEVRNLTAQTGSAICNNGENAALLVLNVEEGTSTSIADGVLNDGANSAALHLIKSGTGTLTMGANASWTGGMTISQGTVIAALSGSEYINAAGGIGASSATINIEEKGTLILDITTNAHNKGMNGNTLLPQTLKGTGTVVLQSGGEVMFSNQTTAFEGTVQLKDNTRLYIGRLDFDYGYEGYNNLNALSASTIVVESGSQAKVTNFYRYGSLNAISTTADFVISGDGYRGARIYNIYASRVSEGALAIDNQSTVYGSITLADNATITSSSAGERAAYPNSQSIAGDTDTFPNNATYGVKNHLGGIIRGRILGEGKDLTFGGNEGMTITADSANTFRNLIIANGNGNNDDKFALRLDGGKAVSQTSTALGMGNVTLNDNLILRLAGTGTANQTDVEYTYANNITAGKGSTIQSYNITNKLTGTVSMADTLNLSTANGGALHLAGGVSGSGTLNIGENSKVILGESSAARNSSTFSGNVVTGPGADLTLESAAAVAPTTTISGTDSLTLRLGGTADYTLSGITLGTSAGITASVLTLRFDFTHANTQDYTTLAIGNIEADSTFIDLQLNLLGELEDGSYVLIDGTGDSLSTNFELADALQDGRFSLSSSNGQVILTVGQDTRFFWSSTGNNGLWNTADANWKKEGNNIVYSTDGDVMLNASGLSTPGKHEVITVAEDISAGSICVSSLYELSGSHSLSGSKLTVADGGDLKLGVDATFTDGVQVNNATLTVGEKTLTAHVTAENRALVNLNGSKVSGNITVGEASSLSMNNASVSGFINLSDAGTIITEDNSLTEGSAEAKLSGTLNADGTGNLSVLDGPVTLDGNVTLDSLSIAGGKRVTLRNSSEDAGAGKIFGELVLGSSAKLTVYNNITNKTSESASIGTLTMAGTTAVIEEIQGSGYMKIGTLNMAEGVASATLTLEKAANPAAPIQTTIFELGADSAPAGNFAGIVDLRQRHNHSGAEGHKHSVFITLSGSDTLSHAVVQMMHQPATKGLLGLGVNAGGEGGSATIAGLASDASLGNRVLVFSGYAPQDVSWHNDEGYDKNLGEVARTLRINTAENTSYEYHGQVREMLSIVKEGAGKQTFSGNSEAFNGSIEILEGTLAFTGDALNMLSSASSVTVNGGTLDISSYDFNTGGGLAINNFSFSDTSVLELGALQADKTYNLFSFDTILENWTSLGVENFSINGSLLSSMEHATLSLGWDGSFSYSMGWDLVWNGGNAGTWTTASGNEVWLNSDSSNAGFCNGDSVTFESDATVTLGSDITVSAMQVNSGTVVVKDSGSYAFNAGSVNVVDGATLQINYSDTACAENNKITQLMLGNQAVFATHDAKSTTSDTWIGTLELNGDTATIKDLNHAGKFYIETLTLQSGRSSATLNLVKNADIQNVTAFEFGSSTAAAGNFAGEIKLSAQSTDGWGNGRPAAIILSNKDIAAKAVINLESISTNTPNAATSILALGINADNTTIAGLESGKALGTKAKLFSGSIGVSSTEGWATGNIDNASTRTLTINTAEGGNHTFYGEVMSINGNKLNLVKDGKGTQSFLGSGSFGSVTVKGGTLTLGGSMTVDVSSDANRIFDVAENARLNISSSATFNNTANVKLEKTGTGTMTVNSKISQNWLNIRTGTLEVAYTGDDGNSISTIDAGMNGAATGQVLVKKGATLSSEEIWMKQGSIALEEGGTLKYKSAVISGESSSATAIIERTDNRNGGKYVGIGDANVSISNARVKYTGGNATISNKLTNSSVENAGGGVLTVTHTGNTLSGVVASAGDITLQNLAANTSLNLLEIAAGYTVNAYVGTNVDEKQGVSVASTGTALLSGGATLNTSLTLADGATLEMHNLTADSSVTINGALTFNGQVEMGTKLLAAVNALTGWEESLTLFTGLAGGVSLPAAAAANADEMVRASEVFSNVTNGNLYVSYQVIDNVGSLMVINVPEPTTTTLSLLALSALAARRRRKN